MQHKLLDFEQQYGGVVRKDEPLARYTTFKIGGTADVFVECRTRDEFVKAVMLCRTIGIPLTILGGGTNILVSDAGVRGVVIRNLTSAITMRGMKGVLSQGKTERLVFVEADSGASMNKLVRMTVDEGLSGLEMHLGLPGTVGGAIYMNSKWTHPAGFVGDAVYQATLIDKKGNVNVVPANYFQFAYDYSKIQKTGECLVSVVFGLKQSEKETLWGIANESVQYRRETQPQGIASPGCTFQNLSQAQALSAATPGHTQSAGFLIDHAGLKGLREGGAMISDVHANFIVNLGGATARDVVELIRRAKHAVHEKFGVDLIEEIVYIGDFEK